MDPERDSHREKTGVLVLPFRGYGILPRDFWPHHGPCFIVFLYIYTDIVLLLSFTISLTKSQSGRVLLDYFKISEVEAKTGEGRRGWGLEMFIWHGPVSNHSRNWSRGRI